jgi:DNA-binding response OmpR family regulator
VALFEHGKPRPRHGRRPASSGLALLRGGHLGRHPFDASRACPAADEPREISNHDPGEQNANSREAVRNGLNINGVEASDRPVRVLVVEDDKEIAHVLQRSLRLDGYEVKLAADGVQALDEAHAFLPDLIVLDLGLPRLDGIDVARRLREDGDDVPILMLTARDALESRVEGLDVGADDYLVKPFERQELLARLRALLRRRPPRGMAPLRVGDLMLNPDTHEVTRGDRAIDLTQREFELLEYLMRNERLVISRQKLLDEVWGYDPFSITNTIEVFVSNLRRKLEAGGEPRLLHTVRGAGYVLRV